MPGERPVSAGCSAPANFDSCVTHIRWTLQNDLSYVGPDDAGASWTYTPLSAGCSAPSTYDGCVTHIRWTLQNDLSSVGPDNTGNVEFVARIK